MEPQTSNLKAIYGAISKRACLHQLRAFYALLQDITKINRERNAANHLPFNYEFCILNFQFSPALDKTYLLVILIYMEATISNLSSSTASSVTYPYQSIFAALRDKILAGEWKPGQQLDTENDLVEQFGTSRSTMKKSLKMLEQEGLVRGEQGRGRFVCEQEKPVQNKTKTIGVLIEETQHLYHPVLGRRLAGIQSVTRKAGYHLNVVAVNSLEHPEGTSWPELMDLQKIQGVIVMAQFAPVENIEELARQVPVIWMDSHKSNPSFGEVRLDYTGAMFDAAQHVAELGHQKIGLLSIGEQFSIGYAQRCGARLGLRRGLQDNSINLQEITCADYEIQFGYEQTKPLVQSADRPTTLLCGSDELAVGAFKAINEAGLNVPDDISLVGCNDIYSEYTDDIPVPPLTTVHLGFREIGMSAAKRLIAWINGDRQQGEANEVPARLITRQTTAAPPDIIRSAKQADAETNTYSDITENQETFSNYFHDLSCEARMRAKQEGGNPESDPNYSNSASATALAEAVTT